MNMQVKSVNFFLVRLTSRVVLLRRCAKGPRSPRAPSPVSFVGSRLKVYAKCACMKERKHFIVWHGSHLLLSRYTRFCNCMFN